MLRVFFGAPLRGGVVASVRARGKPGESGLRVLPRELRQLKFHRALRRTTASPLSVISINPASAGDHSVGASSSTGDLPR